MKNLILKLFMITIFSTSPSLAQEVVNANSEDLAAFDDMFSPTKMKKERNRKNKKAKSEFDRFVMKEARKIKEEKLAKDRSRIRTKDSKNGSGSSNKQPSISSNSSKKSQTRSAGRSGKDKKPKKPKKK